MSDAPLARVLTAGLHGSASTWVFNVARELMGAAYGVDSVHPCHAAKPADLDAAILPPGRHIVAKTHGWPGLAAFAQAWPGRLVLSVRDPRDAVVSLMERFGETFERSAQGVTHDCKAAMECAQAGFAVLRYEDRFFDNAVTVDRLAAYLGLTVPDAELARIFAAYRTESVREFAAGVKALPPERQQGEGDFRFDRLTQITHNHIGNAQAGKWRERLDTGQRAALTQHFRPFLAAFRYPALPV